MLAVCCTLYLTLPCWTAGYWMGNGFIGVLESAGVLEGSGKGNAAAVRCSTCPSLCWTPPPVQSAEALLALLPGCAPSGDY